MASVVPVHVSEADELLSSRAASGTEDRVRIALIVLLVTADPRTEELYAFRK